MFMVYAIYTRIRRHNPASYQTHKEKSKLAMGKRATEDFSEMKKLLTSAPILQQAKEAAPFIIRTDVLSSQPRGERK